MTSLAKRQNLNGKFNINSHFYTGEHLLENKKISHESATHSTNFWFVCMFSHVAQHQSG